MSAITFRAKLTTAGARTIVKLPASASRQLRSRGLNYVEGTFDGHTFHTPLEPDGRGGHWFTVTPAMLKPAKASPGDAAAIAIEPLAEWPEPNVPADLKKALAAAPQVRDVWDDITTLARWDWIRWIGATKNPQTRAIRIEKTVSKLKSGKRAACCFDRSQCTDPELSKNGVLLD